MGIQVSSAMTHHAAGLSSQGEEDSDSDDLMESDTFPHPVTAVMISNRKVEPTNDSNSVRLWDKSHEDHATRHKPARTTKLTNKKHNAGHLRSRVLDHVHKSHDFLVTPRSSDKAPLGTNPTGLIGMCTDLFSPAISSRSGISQPESGAPELFPSVDNNRKAETLGVNDLSSQLKQSLEHHRVNSSAKCLRCHNLYRVQENHDTACMYHPKSKRKVEKYDISGKLMTLSYLWECCQQGPEIHGCTTAKHV